MAQEQEAVPVGTWRLYKVANAALGIMPRHRDPVLGVDDVERDLSPAIAAFLPAAGALRAFNVKVQTTADEHARRLQQLRTRTVFWLTYVRLNSPKYVASEMNGRQDGADVLIDRARGVIELAQSYAVDETPRYAAPMLAELVPMYERCLSDLAAGRDTAEEEQRLQGQVRELMLPLYRGVVTLRALLRNALGASHVDVRALDTDPPSKKKSKDERPAAKAKQGASQRESMPDPTVVLPELVAPTTAQRLALVRG